MLSVNGEMICISLLLLLGRLEEGSWEMWQIWRSREICRGMWWEELKTNKVEQDLGVIGRVILELLFSGRERESVAKFHSLRIGTIGVTL
jgi:hypothetical protein